MGRRIVLECLKLILNLPVNVLILAFCLSAFCLNHPDCVILFLNDVVSVEEPLMPKRIQIYDREVLLTAVAVLVDPVYIVMTFTILLEQLLRNTADQRGGKSGSVVLVGVAQIFDFFLHARIVLEEVLIRNMKIRYLWFRHVHLNIALAGKIDLIVTKSVSRFARNTVDSLTTIRKLKENGIECYFEKKNIWTFDGKGELLITIMSSLAQEESRSISENCTWGQRKRFADGKVSVAYSRFLGYDRGPNGGLVINQDEAKTIRKIYRLFLEGMTPCCRKPTPSITSRRKQRSTKARFRSTTSRVNMRPSLIRMFSTRCRLSLRNAVRAGTATAVSTTSPAKSNAASAAAGTAPRSGTARTNTGKSSGNAITNTTARSAPRHT